MDNVDLRVALAWLAIPNRWGSRFVTISGENCHHDYASCILKTYVCVVAVAGVAGALAGCSGQDSASSGDRLGSTASAMTAGTAASRFIVVLKAGVVQQGVAGQGVADVGSSLQQQYGGAIARTYEHALHGFAMDLSAAAAAALSADNRVAYVEPDQVGHIVDSEANATWGIDQSISAICLSMEFITIRTRRALASTRRFSTPASTRVTRSSRFRTVGRASSPSMTS